jgi:hypothetical protein
MAHRSVRCTFLDPGVPDVEVALPASVTRAAGHSSFGVLLLGRIEVELNDSAAAVLPDFFAGGDAEPEDQLTLRGGLRVDVGRVGGREGTGFCFGVHVGRRRLLGAVPPGVRLALLTAWLADLRIYPTRSGIQVHPLRTHWAPGRPPHAALVLVLRSGARLLADVRPAHRPPRWDAGVAVPGGRLARVAPAGRAEYLTLDAPGHVVHLLPPTTDHLDEVAAVGSGLTVTAVPA